jgi:hypothetical protein
MSKIKTLAINTFNFWLLYRNSSIFTFYWQYEHVQQYSEYIKMKILLPE